METGSSTHIRYAVEDGVARLTIQRPPANVLHLEALRELTAAVEAAPDAQARQADQAAGIGLVSEAVDAEALAKTEAEWIEHLRGLSTPALRLTKRALL